MTLERFNRQAITFCAAAVLFVGSLFYFISVAAKTRDGIQNRYDAVASYSKNI